MRTVTTEERRARIGSRHALQAPARTVTDVAHRLLALHSTDPASVYLSIHARLPSVGFSDVDAALYTDRTLLRLHAMRTTLWVIPTDLFPVIEAGVSSEVAEKNRQRLLRLIAPHVRGDVHEWFERARHGVIAHLSERGSAFGDELKQAVPELQLEFESGGGTLVASSRVLFLIAAAGDIVRTEPRGSWRSNIHSWRLRSDWVETPAFPSADDARADIAHRWLTAFGPGSTDDLAWWTGWGKRVARHAIDRAGAVAVHLEDGSEAYLANGDEAEESTDRSWIALLPALDPTVMGWKERSWYLGDHADALFDRNGNAGPTIWADGRVVGGWAHHPERGVVTQFLEPVAADIEDRVRAGATTLGSWLGDHVVVPRFRTPLEREMTR